MEDMKYVTIIFLGKNYSQKKTKKKIADAILSEL